MPLVVVMPVLCSTGNKWREGRRLEDGRQVKANIVSPSLMWHTHFTHVHHPASREPRVHPEAFTHAIPLLPGCAEKKRKRCGKYHVSSKSSCTPYGFLLHDAVSFTLIAYASSGPDGYIQSAKYGPVRSSWESSTRIFFFLIIKRSHISVNYKLMIENVTAVVLTIIHWPPSKTTLSTYSKNTARPKCSLSRHTTY